MSLLGDKIIAGIKGIDFEPKILQSKRYKVWLCSLSLTTCKPCFDLHGKLYLPEDAPPTNPNMHERCGCVVIWSNSINKGTATFQGSSGIDLTISNGESLPENYVTKKQAKKLGWKPTLMNLQQVIKFGIIGGDVYKNKEGKLPSTYGRIWYEADINYTGGMRNSSRILYSNDGLIFVTYDHYFTFYEIR